MKLKEDRNNYYFFFSKDNNTQKENLKFDFEHIIPIQKFKTENLIKLIPVSALGNMCYMPVKDNRSKKDISLHSYAEKYRTLVVNKDFLKFVYYPENEIINFTDFQKDQFIRSYNQFIINREKFLIEEFTRLLNRFSW
jgi:hypothetical protein